ncbi:hypothetical protein CEW83_07620 [Parazoarcus communis]|uniref:Uncharacterized protein n=2 Tax=Parazoarcus communis TaxID=41977 RepID=A0A2U8GN81_9RHOO|nr:hypothetical protein CEW83_07620 [Parazoarcus communis]
MMAADQMEMISHRIKAMVQRHNEEVATLKAKIKERDDLIAHLHKVIKNRDDIIAHRDGVIKSKDNKIKSNEYTIEDFRTSIIGDQEMSVRMTDEIHAFNARIRDRVTDLSRQMDLDPVSSELADLVARHLMNQADIHVNLSTANEGKNLFSGLFSKYVREDTQNFTVEITEEDYKRCADRAMEEAIKRVKTNRAAMIQEKTQELQESKEAMKARLKAEQRERMAKKSD